MSEGTEQPGAGTVARPLRRKEPTVEVLVCTFNGAKFLALQLDSIARQTRAVDRVSIFDDRSSDDTLEIIAEFMAEHGNGLPKISVTRNEHNVGWLKNFANAILSSTEDIVFLCDQDDVWHAQKVEKLVLALEDPDVDLVFSDSRLIDGQGGDLGHQTAMEVLGLKPAELAKDRLGLFSRVQRANFIGGAAMAIRASVAKAALPCPAEMPIDYWLGLICCARGRARFLSLCLYQYRQHGNNVIGITPTSNWAEVVKIWRQPFTDRDRERAVWMAVASRLSGSRDERLMAFAEQKVKFLQTSTADTSGLLQRSRKLGGIFWRLATGKYTRFSTPLAAWADIASTLRSRSPST